MRSTPKMEFEILTVKTHINCLPFAGIELYSEGAILQDARRLVKRRRALRERNPSALVPSDRRAVLVCRLAVLGADNGILAGEVVKLRARVPRGGIYVDLIGDGIPAPMFGAL